MAIAVLALATGIIFLILDALMLTFVLQPLFVRHIGEQMISPIRIGPAVAFYLIYIAGLLWLVSIPALRSGGQVWVQAAVLGLVAYATFELTSYTVMRDWHWHMVVVDTTWGAVLTALSAGGGLAITRWMTQT